ncbi:MAG: VanZ family protein [Clostridia bacterium]|nr:VanZ family protein [Clostridia bacterium]
MSVRQKRRLYGSLALVMMLVIFLMSAADGERSAGMSGKLTELAVQKLYPGYEGLNTAAQEGAFDLMHHLLRKAAHFIEYAILGALYCLFLHTFPVKRARLYAWLLGTAYAATDEVHQLFVLSRGASPADVMLDSLGVACGVLLAAAFSAFFTQTRQKRALSSGGN